MTAALADPLLASDTAECTSCRRVVGSVGDPVVVETRDGHASRFWCLGCAHRLGVGSDVPSLSFRCWVDDPDDRDALMRFRAWVRRQPMLVCP